MTKIFYVDGVCGSGKTTAMVELVNKWASCGGKTVIAQPSKRLLGETARKLRGRIEKYTADIYPGQVYKQFNMDLAVYGRSDDAFTALTTHNAVLNAPPIDARQHWHLFVDEIPSVDRTVYLNIGETNGWVAQTLEPYDIEDNLCLGLKVADGHKETWKRWKRNATEDSLISCAAIQGMAELLLHTSYDVFVTRASWQTRHHNNWQLRVHAILKPDVFSGWQSVRIMGANFPKSMLALVWQQMGVELSACPSLRHLAKAHDRDTGERVKVHYFSGRPWSKHTRDRVKENPFEGLAKQCDALFGRKPHLWVANNDVPDSHWTGCNGTRISNVAHGLNEYRHINNVVFLSALNDMPAHFGFLERKYDIAAPALKSAKAYETLYQCVMRTSLREKAGPIVNVVVPDKDHADFLCAQMFPGAKQLALDVANKEWGAAQATRGRPIKAEKLSGSERVRLTRERRAQFLLTKNALNKSLNVSLSDAVIGLTWQPSTFSKSAELLGAQLTNWDDVRQLMLEAHALKYACKEDNSLLNLCSFSLDQPAGTFKGRQNIAFVSGIMLDFDGGLLEPERVSALLSDIKHMVFNSYNNGKDGQWKFRVFIPFDSPCPVELAEGIWDALAERIEFAGWYVGRDPSKSRMPSSGLDVSKRPANSFYYMPCISSQGKKWTFLIDNWSAPLLDTTEAINWVPQDVCEYEWHHPVLNHGEALRTLLEELKSRAENNNIERKDNRADVVQKCVDGYRAITEDGVRRNSFFNFVRRMVTAGVDDFDILAAMQDRKSVV